MEARPVLNHFRRKQILKIVLHLCIGKGKFIRTNNIIICNICLYFKNSVIRIKYKEKIILLVLITSFVCSMSLWLNYSLEQTTYLSSIYTLFKLYTALAWINPIDFGNVLRARAKTFQTISMDDSEKTADTEFCLMELFGFNVIIKNKNQTFWNQSLYWNFYSKIRMTHLGGTYWNKEKNFTHFYFSIFN